MTKIALTKEWDHHHMAASIIGSPDHPLKVAVIGSGPSGFFAAEELLSQKGLAVRVDMFDRLPTPFGLVRGGVAPDHQKIKGVAKIFDKTAARPEFRFFGHVEFGRDILLEDLRKFYDAVIFAVGAKSDRKMGIKGEGLEGSHAATEFVGWYNGHPDYHDCVFDLSQERAAVVGNGNVAMDVTRILSTDPAELESTDIAEYALEALKKSKVREIYLLGRRGPAQAAFTNPEIRELAGLKGVDLVVDPREMQLDALSKESLAAGEGGPNAKNNVEILTEQSKKGPGSQPRKVHVRFLESPVELIGENGRVTGIRMERNELFKDKDGSLRPRGTGQFETLSAGLVFRSVGYKGVALPGIPYDDRKGNLPNVDGRVGDPKLKELLPGVYAVGWAKRGPSGVIGTNKPDAAETVRHLLEDFVEKTAEDLPGPEGIVRFLSERKVKAVDYAGWKILDGLETERGKAKGKIREKFTNEDEMLAALEQKSAVRP